MEGSRIAAVFDDVYSDNSWFHQPDAYVISWVVVDPQLSSHCYPLVAHNAPLHIQFMTRPAALLDQILDVPPAERLRLVEDIWDSLAVSVEDVPVPQWHRDELDRRLADTTEPPMITPEQLKARLR